MKQGQITSTRFAVGAISEAERSISPRVERFAGNQQRPVAASAANKHENDASEEGNLRLSSISWNLIILKLINIPRSTSEIQHLAIPNHFRSCIHCHKSRSYTTDSVFLLDSALLYKKNSRQKDACDSSQHSRRSAILFICQLCNVTVYFRNSNIRPTWPNVAWPDLTWPNRVLRTNTATTA